MQTAIEFEFTTDDFADIVDTAGYAIGYWADETEYIEPYFDSDPEASYTIYCEGIKYALKQGDIETAMVRISEDKVNVSSSIKTAVLNSMEEDMGEIDGYAADAIVQVACFGEIIYG